MDDFRHCACSSVLSDGRILYHTPDSVLVAQYLSGVPIATISAELAAHDRIGITVARRRVLTALIHHEKPATQMHEPQ